MFSSNESRMLEEIRKLEAERLGIRELRKHNSELYGYYMKWLVKRENTLIRKYIKKFDRWPDLKATIITPTFGQTFA